MNQKLKELIRRVETWPEEVQDELAELGLAFEAERSAPPFRPSTDELAAIDDADQSGIASEADVRAAFAKFRR